MKLSFSARCELLTKGGYGRYREMKSKQLEDLCNLLIEEYEGDLNKLREKAGKELKREKKLLMEFKGRP